MENTIKKEQKQNKKSQEIKQENTQKPKVNTKKSFFKKNKSNIENKKTEQTSDNKIKSTPKTKESTQIAKLQAQNEKLQTQLTLSGIEIETLKFQMEKSLKQFKEKVVEIEQKAKDEIQKHKDENSSKFELKSTELKKYGNQKFFEDFIMVLKNFEFAIKAGEKQENIEVKRYLQGFSMIYKQIEGLFANYGLVKIEPYIGEKFNPEIHQITEKKPNPKFKELIIEIKSFGYKLHDRVIRPAIVVVGE
ncbi:nucleotide exchange factor GrpE [Mesomycoplasma neurolyticum]|uniref:Protein GrpE n=1 Tax=Mesomycoplasma neurolyticum TaxID=2120 RepID=A0A449A634_9BACT|nr:nucleotide exchange factor GrpE [Mesomycoplasma neurolyticum]VEU59687.1 heat shock protein GrpE [Mesomycoplasma neurolyticum]